MLHSGLIRKIAQAPTEPSVTEASSRDMNEEQFTKRVVIPFLMRAGFYRIRYVHGQDERGRDLVFFDSDRLGQELLCAAQVKTGDISGKHKSLISDIIGQLDEGHRVHYLDPETGKTRRVGRMYLIISGLLVGGAKEQFHSALAERPNILVLDRQSIELFTDRRDYATTFELRVEQIGTGFFREFRKPPRLPLLSRGTVLDIALVANRYMARSLEVLRVEYDPILRSQHVILNLPLDGQKPPDRSSLQDLHASLEEWFANATQDLFDYLSDYGEGRSG